MLHLNDLAELANRHHDLLKLRVAEFEIGNRFFAFNLRPAIMGVINLSADSWYRESVCLGSDYAIQRGVVLGAQGADIIDVGAESTLMQAAIQNSDSQNSRLLPVVRKLREAGLLVSVETYLPEVASAVLASGANVLNLTGTEHSETIYRQAADAGAAVIICYVQGPNARQVTNFDLRTDPVPLMYEYFAQQVELATNCGLTRLFIDPGLGFYYRNLQDSTVRIRHQMRTFLNTFRLRKLGFPTCHALPHAFEHFGEEVRCAEAFFAVLAALGQTDLFRTHEVPRVKAVLDTLRDFRE